MMPQERRLGIRKPLDHIAYLSLPPNNGGFVTDVSDGGLGFHSISPVEANGPIHFRFAIDSAERIRAVGELAWKDKTGKIGGLRFTQLPDEVREHIRVWAGQSQMRAQARGQTKVQAGTQEVERAEAREMMQPRAEASQQAEAQAPTAPMALDSAVPEPPIEAKVESERETDPAPLVAVRNPLLYNLKPPIYSGPSYGLSMFPVKELDFETEAAALALPQHAAIKHPIAAVGLTIALAFVVSLGIFGYVCSSRAGDLLFSWEENLFGGSYSQPISEDPAPPANPAPGYGSAPQQ